MEKEMETILKQTLFSPFPKYSAEAEGNTSLDAEVLRGFA